MPIFPHILTVQRIWREAEPRLSCAAVQDLLDDVSGIANTVAAPLNAISGTTKVLVGKVQSAASSSEGDAESPMLQQAAQPTEPVSAIAAGDAEEVPSRPANSGAGGSDDGRSAAKEAQLPQ